MICPEESVVDIWKEHKLNSFRERREYGADDLAFSMKTAVTNWAYNNIRTPVGISCQINVSYAYLQVRLFLGVVFCSDDKETNTYNWSLDQNLSTITFFEPQSGRIITIPEYYTYFWAC